MTPKEWKINFAVPLETTLKLESPKYNKDIWPRILHPCLGSFSLASPTPISLSFDGKNIYIALTTPVKKICKEWKDHQHWENAGKVITDCIADISTKSDVNFSNTSSDNLASVKAALLWILAHSSKFAGGNIRVRSPHGEPYIKQLPLREQQSFIW